NVMQEIAAFLNKDALLIRRLNCYGAGDRNITPYGQLVENNTLPDIFERLVETAEYESRMAAISVFNSQSRTHLKGLALTPIKFGISFNTKFLNQANALVNVYKDGTI